jgi:hypothetical protein
MAIVRMVKLWHEYVIGSHSLYSTDSFRWIFILLPASGTGVDFEASNEDYLKRVKEMVGDDSIPVEILGVSKWFINEIVAEYYSDGNM